MMDKSSNTGSVPARQDFRILAANMSGLADVGIPVAASRCGAYGVLNLEAVRDELAASELVRRASRLAQTPIAVRLDPSADFTRALAERLPDGIDAVILPARRYDTLKAVAPVVVARGLHLFIEVTSGADAHHAREFPVDAFLAKGHESGGYVGEETAFVLLQRLLKEQQLPVYVWGGIGIHTIGACYAAGASGVLLDSQLLLTPQASVPPRLPAFLERMEGDETLVAGSALGQLFRFFKRPGLPGAQAFARSEEELTVQGGVEAASAWLERLSSCVDWERPDKGVWPLGQDAVFAAALTGRFHTVAGIVDGLRAAAGQHLSAAQRLAPLAPGSPFARAHGIAYPVLQGPMTRVSDIAAFAKAVADGGGLPFLALALMRGPQVEKLLAETKTLLSDRPWGVGILGFVPAELRNEQLEVIERVRPANALIAGGRPDQAAKLENLGIATYLHVPTPSLLDLFLESGARRFVFEGRECGGHVGPRTSFVLWESMIETLLEAIRKGISPEELHVVFAGGIHDARSAAMVSAMAAPLAEQGVRIAVLLGTAYLFTEEAVSSGAIVHGFQREALSCSATVTLISGPGHITRCADTPFNLTFREERRRLLAEGRSVEETRDSLEALNLGRLRIASKGIQRHPVTGEATEHVSDEEQRHQGMYMIGQVAALRDATCTIAQLHEEISAGSTAWLRGIPGIPSVGVRSKPEVPPCDIAIVGMGCLLPDAPDVATFWSNILNRVDAIREVPADRFEINRLYDAGKNARDKVYSRWGGFLEPVPFDPMRYGIPPAALPSIDPMQLLALVVAEQALKDAGYDRRPYSTESTSVVLGASGGLGDLGIDYAIRSNLGQLADPVPESILTQLPEWTEDSFAGILLNVSAGRVANRFNLGGVNFTVDAACASSLAAIYLAARELNAGTSDMVIAGGVDTVQSPFGFLCFSKSQALSPRGRCSPFDAQADGIAISEGLSMVVLKRLKDAERDGDRVYAVIKGIGGSSDGRGRSMTAPRVEGQKLAIQRAWRQARAGARSLELIEAHGTGTVAGDTAEIAALSELFTAEGTPEHACAIGSVKSMIGHTKSAAGVTGLMKAALALYHKVLPPTLHVDRPNRTLARQGVPFYVNTEIRPWLTRPDEAPLQAGVSAFGFGGTNFHAVLEEHSGDTRAFVDRCAADRWPHELFFWQAGTVEGLRAAIDGAGQEAYPTNTVRLAIVASSPADLRAKIEIARTWLNEGRTDTSDPAKGIYLGSGETCPGIAFLFPGQGSQYPGMLRELSVYLPEMREHLGMCDRQLASEFPQRLSRLIYPVSVFNDDERRRAMEALTETDVTQPALGCVEIGLYRFLERAGLRPGFVAGHSYGEYVALCAAGALSTDSLFRLSAARGRAIRKGSGPDAGGMAAVNASGDEVRCALRDLDGITLANFNAPRQTVIAGTHAALESAIGRLAASGLDARRLPVACAFHSPLMEPARDVLARELAGHAFGIPRIPVFSNTLGGAYPADPARIAEILADHLVRPVDFTAEVKSMYDQGARVFVEVGPKTVLSNLGRQILDGTDAKIFSIDAPATPGLFSLLNVLAAMAAMGAPIDLAQLTRGRTVARSTTAASATWLVSGARAYPAGQPHPRKQPVPLEQPVAAPAPAATLPAIAAPIATDAVMVQFQQLMGQFLTLQSSVMTGFLQGSAIPAAPPVPQSIVVPQPAPSAATPEPPKQPEVVAHSNGDLRSHFINMVSERTGYPPEMLDLDAGIEADLGIDSIKRVEVLGGFRRSRRADEQARLQPIMERLTTAKTLRQILEGIETALRDDPAPAPELPRFRLTPVAAPPAVGQPSSAAAALLRGVPREQSTGAPKTGWAGPEAAPQGKPSCTQPAPGGSPAAAEDGCPTALGQVGNLPHVVLLTDDETGIAGGLAEELGRRGARPVLLRSAVLDTPESVREAIEGVRRSYGPIGALVHLLPLRELPEWTESVRLHLRSFFLLVREILADLQELGAGGGALIACATGRGGDFGMQAAPSIPVSHHAIADYLKCLSLEVNARCKVIDLDPGEPSSILGRKLLDELVSNDDLLQVGLPGDRRLTLRPRAVHRNGTTSGRIGSDWVFLLTGGARGIGAKLARELTRRYQPRLILAGRSKSPAGEEPVDLTALKEPAALRAGILSRLRRVNPSVKPAEIEAEYRRILRERELRATLRDLHEAGARVEYVSVDVCDEAGMTHLLDRIYREYGRLDVVVHGAGVIEDKLVRDKTPESFDRVVRTKADSSRVLSRLLKPDSLRCLIFMSSITAAFGNYGQADYAAANGFMNGFACKLAGQWPCRVIAMNWGPWDGAGMVSESLREQFLSRGVQLIPPAVGVAAIIEEIEGQQSDPVVVLGDGPWSAPAEGGEDEVPLAVGASA